MEHPPNLSGDSRAPGDSRLPGPVAGAVLALLLLLPSLPYLVTLPHFGACQYNDYYGILNLLREGDGFTCDPVRWLTLKSNEHTITLPALVYLANIRVTHGDNRGLSVFALALLLTILVLLYRMARETPGFAPERRWLPALLLSAAVFAPVPAHSVVMGFSGAIWFLSNAFSVGALYLLAHRSTEGAISGLWPVALLGALGALSYSTNLSLWPALLVAALLLGRSRRDLLPLLLASLGAGLFFFLRYRPLPYHPQPNLGHPATALGHAAVYLGSFLAGEVVPALLLGGGGMLLSILLWITLVRRSPESAHRAAPWIGIQVYALGNALGTGIGRSGFGLAQALNSRYGSLAALFWIGGVILFLMCVAPPGGRRPRPAWRRLAVAAVVSGVLVASWIRGLAVLEKYLLHARGQPLAAEALRLGARDLGALEFLSPVPGEVWLTAPFLRTLGHVPFHREPTSWTGLPVLPGPPGDLPRIKGWVDSVGPLEGTAFRVSGWAWSPEDPAVRVLAVDGNGTPLAWMVAGLRRPDVAATVDPAAAWSGWVGYLPPGTAAGEIRALALLRSGRWARIPGRVTITLPAENPPRER